MPLLFYNSSDFYRCCYPIGFLSYSSYTLPLYKTSIYFHPNWMEEALGSIIPFIITVNYYALQTILDIIALGIVPYKLEDSTDTSL